MMTTVMKGKRDETRQEETDLKSLPIILIGGISLSHITKIENTRLSSKGGRAGNIRRTMRTARIIIDHLNPIAAQAIKIR